MDGFDTRNIVWITIDSIRADHTTLGCHHRDTTPNLRRIVESEGGDWFGRCYSQTRWTPASTASVLTGTYLSTHRVGTTSPEVRTLSDSLRTLPEILSDLGYSSFGISTNQYFHSVTGLDRGFDRFIFPEFGKLRETVGLGAIANYLRHVRSYGPGLSLDKRLHNGSSMVTHAAKNWVGSVSSQTDSFFLYIHFNSTHYPYSPPRRFLRPFADEVGLSLEDIYDISFDVFDDVFDVVANGLDLTEDEMTAIEVAYDAELAYVDHLVGQLHDYIQSHASNDTIFVVTSDHGETFGEHGWLGHHVIVSDELLHVPLVVHGMPEISHQHDNFVQPIDLTRTIVEQSGGEAAQFEGINLTETTRDHVLAQRASRENDREKLLDRNPDFDTTRYRWDAINLVRNEEFKFLTGESGDELFELPDETTNVIDAHPETAEALRELLRDQLPDFAIDDDDGSLADFDENMYERLRDMGYL